MESLDEKFTGSIPGYSIIIIIIIIIIIVIIITTIIIILLLNGRSNDKKLYLKIGVDSTPETLCKKIRQWTYS